MSRIEAITPRERTILDAVAEGLTNADIAAELGISRSTVDNCAEMLRVKLGARNKAHVVAIAYHHGLLIAPNGRG